MIKLLMFSSGPLFSHKSKTSANRKYDDRLRTGVPYRIEKRYPYANFKWPIRAENGSNTAESKDSSLPVPTQDCESAESMSP